MLCLQILVGIIILWSLFTCNWICIRPWLGLHSSLGMIHSGTFTSLMTMLFICYFKACYSSPGHPSKDWQNKDDIELALLKEPSIVHINPPRWCDKCLTHKPPRTHHCRMCNRCVLRMDHHCPWINNCVGFYNYKSFLLFLIYTSISSVYALFIIIGRTFLSRAAISMTDAIFMWVLVLMVLPTSILVACLLSYHISLISKNYTTIEYNEAFWSSPKKGGHKYDLGTITNLYNILGPSCACWICPTSSPGDGLSFPTAKDNLKTPSRIAYP